MGGWCAMAGTFGTVVFPEAELKVFLVALAEERGRRRLLDHGLEPTEAEVRREAERLSRRDAADSSRAVAPLMRASDAIELDTTDMSATEVVDHIVALARARSAAVG